MFGWCLRFICFKSIFLKKKNLIMDMLESICCSGKENVIGCVFQIMQKTCIGISIENGCLVKNSVDFFWNFRFSFPITFSARWAGPAASPVSILFGEMQSSAPLEIVWTNFFFFFFFYSFFFLLHLSLDMDLHVLIILLTLNLIREGALPNQVHICIWNFHKAICFF